MVQIQERREEEERRRVSAVAAQVRSAAAAECKKLVADARASCHRFKPAPKFWRYLQKEEAEDSGLMSISAGEGDDRYVVVYKTDGPPPPEILEMEREAEEAKTAAEDDMRRREELLAAAAKENVRLREAAGGYAGGAGAARPLTAAQRRQAQIESLARGAETVKMTEKIEKRTVGQIQDECLAHRAREA